MKKAIFTLSVAGAMALTGAWAQDYSAGSQFGRKQQVTPQTTPSRAPGEQLKPVPSGVIYEMSEKGLIIIYPGAPASEGIGERFLTAAPFPGKATPDNIHDGRQQFGGIKLFGFEF